MDQEISSHLVKLRKANPFLATLSLFCNYQFSDTARFFETDGSYISINPQFFQQLPSSEKTGVLLHTTLHAALLHATRRGFRHEGVWNIAADIVVNNIIADAGDFHPPRETAHEPKYKDLSVEQVYEALMHLHNKSKAIRDAAMSMPSTSESGANQTCQKQDANSGQEQGKELCFANGQQSTQSAKIGDSKKQSSPDASQIHGALSRIYPYRKDLVSANSLNSPDESQSKSQQQYWQSAFRKAEAAHRFGSKTQGRVPEGLKREIDLVLNPQLDWRWLLWNFVVRTPCDFDGYDRRFMYRQLYIDQLESDQLRIAVAIDTSGSVDDESLSKFISELRSICGVYQFIQTDLYYVDADIYGPYELDHISRVSDAYGGGGTDFIVFFDEIVKNRGIEEFDLVVYFTDGYADFPRPAPIIETLWVVSPGGLESQYFPFGQVARLAE